MSVSPNNPSNSFVYHGNDVGPPTFLKLQNSKTGPRSTNYKLLLIPIPISQSNLGRQSL